MNRFKRIGISLAAALIFFGSLSVTGANAQGILQEIMQRMDNQQKSLSSLRAKVTMVKDNAQLGVADTTIGTVIYLPQKGRDALVKIDWTKPDESLAVVNKQYVIYRPRLKQAYTGSVNSAKGSAKANGALAFMNMSRAQLRANYTVKYLGEATVSNGVSTWHLELTPKTQASYRSAEIWVDKDGFPVQSKIIEKNGDATTILLSDLEKNITLNGNMFKIDLPRDTKIIKG